MPAFPPNLAMDSSCSAMAISGVNQRMALLRELTKRVPMRVHVGPPCIQGFGEIGIVACQAQPVRGVHDEQGVALSHLKLLQQRLAENDAVGVADFAHLYRLAHQRSITRVTTGFVGT